MKILKISIFSAILFFLAGTFILSSCNKDVDSLESNIKADTSEPIAYAVTSDGDGCSADCAFGSCTATGPGSTCTCRWGSPKCTSGNSTVSSSNFNFTIAGEFKTFLSQTAKVDPPVVTEFEHIMSAANEENWEEYGMAVDAFANTVRSLPNPQQTLIADWISDHE